MTAVVLASHEGSYTVVAGVPLLLRAVLSAQRAGVSAVLVQCNGDPRRARALLDRDPRTRGIEVLHTDRITARGEDYVMLIAADCLVTASSIRAVAELRTPGRIAALRSDEATAATFAIVAGARDHLLPLPMGEGRGDGDQMDQLPALASAGSSRVTIVASHRAVRVCNRADVARAEAALVAELRAATADTDGPIARADRAVSMRLSRWLVRTRLRPNHITVIGTCTGLLAGWALAQGNYASGLLGAWLFWVAVIVDGCDGEVARLKFLESRFGQLFDVITDNIVHVAIFAGLAVGAHRAGRVEHFLLLGATLITGFLCASAATYFCLLGDGPVKHLETSSRRGRIRRRVLQIFEALMNRDFAYLLVVLAVTDRLHWFLWGTVFGTYAYALGLVWVYRWGDRAVSAHASAAPAIESPR